MFVTKKEFESYRDEIKKSLEDRAYNRQALADRIEKCEKELGIFNKKEEVNPFSIASWYLYQSWGESQTNPSLKDRILALEKYLGGSVNEFESRKEVKFVPEKKSRKSKK